MISIDGIYHLKFPVSDIDRSVRFYETVFGAKRLTELDHFTPEGALFGVILDFPGLGTQLQLKLDRTAAAGYRGTTPVALLVDTLDQLRDCVRRLDELKVPHSPVLNGLIQWLIVIEDPDQLQLRIYSRELHGPEVEPSRNDRWLGNWWKDANAAKQ
jgi:catechol 2,3-dioxygenase-like lactoylglutathione lyase family enzyme